MKSTKRFNEKYKTFNRQIHEIQDPRLSQRKCTFVRYSNIVRKLLQTTSRSTILFHLIYLFVKFVFKGAL